MESSRDDFVIAIRSAFLKRGTQQRFSLLTLILVSVIFLVLDSFNFKVVNYVNIVIKEIVYRSSFIVSGPENFIKNNYSTIHRHFKLYGENQKNINDLENLKSKDLSQQIITLENIKLKKLIDDYFIVNNEVFAKVLIDNKSTFLRSVILNKGSKNNIKLGMIVLDGMYLVGKIVEVNYITSRVLLISDLNSKIPVTLEPGDTQAIMSGSDDGEGVLQYIKDKNLKKSDKDLLVFTSGTGGVFKGGIPIGTIKNENTSADKDKVVNFYKDFSQLKYVKVLSFSKEQAILDQDSRKAVGLIDDKIKDITKDKETLKILLEQKKIADEIRIKIEEENTTLKSIVIKLKNEKINLEKNLKEQSTTNIAKEFIRLDLLYGKKCKKNLFNNLYKKGSAKYINCVLKKDLKSNESN
jgi:rod shape-determining protein MreC